jgi:hypothetical protein
MGTNQYDCILNSSSIFVKISKSKNLWFWVLENFHKQITFGSKFLVQTFLWEKLMQKLQHLEKPLKK